MSRDARLNPTFLPEAKHHNCALDNETLYVPESVAKALRWKPGQDLKGLQLTLHGWEPGYFAISRTGSESGEIILGFDFVQQLMTGSIERLAKSTIESSRNPLMLEALKNLKDR